MFITTLEPRISETDAMGHINNTTIPVWLEAGRHQLFAMFNPDHQFHDWRMVVVKTTVEYKDQLFFGTPVEVRCWVKRVGNTSIELYEEIWQEDRKCIISSTIYVNFCKKLQRGESIPGSIRKQLAEHMYREEVTG